MPPVNPYPLIPHGRTAGCQTLKQQWLQARAQPGKKSEGWFLDLEHGDCRLGSACVKGAAEEAAAS